MSDGKSGIKVNNRIEIHSQGGVGPFVKHMLEGEITPEKIEEHTRVLERTRDLLTTPIETMGSENRQDIKYGSLLEVAIEITSGDKIPALMNSLGITKPEEQRQAWIYLTRHGINPDRAYLAKEMLEYHQRIS